MRSAHDWGRAFTRRGWSILSRPASIGSVILALAAGTLLAGCNESPEPTAPGVAARSAVLATASAQAAVKYPIVTIKPAVTTLAVGGKATITASLSNASTSWYGHFTTWKSSDPTVVSVTTTGWGGADQGNLVGLKNGKATITGTTESNTVGSMTITVGTGGTTTTTPAPVLGGTMHEPSGMSAQFNTGSITSFSQTGMTMISPSTWTSPYENGEAGNLTAVAGGGLRVTYPPTLPGGYSPVRFMTPGFASHGTGWLYIRMQIRFSPNWTTNGNVDVKLAEPHTLYEGNENDNIDAWVTGSQSVLITGTQGPGADHNLMPNTGPGVITGGAWHTIELLYGPESKSGAGNGTYQAWVDGAQVTNMSNVNWLASGETPGWHELLFDPCYGGGTAHPPSSSPNIYWDFNQLYIATK
jgi:Bacterial Ig-like domain (group 2)